MDIDVYKNSTLNEKDLKRKVEKDKSKALQLHEKIEKSEKSFKHHIKM